MINIKKNIRLIGFYLLLLTVLCVGLPLDPISSAAYDITKYLGIDIPMTPLTSDMAMMSDFKGNTSYEKSLKLIIYSQNKIIDIDENKLLFYKHKIPLHLYYEVIGEKDQSPEGQAFICKTLRDFNQGLKIEAFELRSNNDSQENKSMGFNKKRVCYE